MTTLLLLFGLNALAAACNLPAWWRLMVAWWHEPGDKRQLERALIRSAMVVSNAMLLMSCWGRLSDTVIGTPLPLVPIHFAFPPVPLLPFRPWVFEAPWWTLALWLGGFLAAELGFLLASAVALRRVRKPAWCPVTFAVLAPLWILDVLLWSFRT